MYWTLNAKNTDTKLIYLTLGKVYESPNEEAIRFQIFADNLKKIKLHNYLHSKGLKSYTLGINKFADMVSCIEVHNSEFIIMIHNLIINYNNNDHNSAEIFAVGQ